MNQNIIRKNFEEYLTLSGQKVRFISAKINLHETTLCHWRKGRDVSDRSITKIVNYLMNNKGKFL